MSIVVTSAVLEVLASVSVSRGFGALGALTYVVIWFAHKESEVRHEYSRVLALCHPPRSCPAFSIHPYLANTRLAEVNPIILTAICEGRYLQLHSTNSSRTGFTGWSLDAAAICRHYRRCYP